MTKAKTKQEFLEAWTEHLNQLSDLAYSLKRTGDQLAVLQHTRALKTIVERAAKDTFGD